MHSKSRWGQERLWKDQRDVKELIVANKDNDRNKGEDGSIRRKYSSGKIFMIGRQLVGLRSLVNSVDSVNESIGMWSIFICVSLFFSQNSSLSL